MTLTCTLKDKSKKVVVVPIEPPMKGYEDVKPRLLEMKAFAQEGLGMVRSWSCRPLTLKCDGWLIVYSR
jgi:hypothetical protein